jgi:hypothetical protein
LVGDGTVSFLALKEVIMVFGESRLVLEALEAEFYYKV